MSNRRQVLVWATVCSLAVLSASTARAECPMASSDDRYVLVQNSTEAMGGGGWSTRRVVHDLKGWRVGIPKQVYTGEAVGTEAPDLDYLSRGLREALKPYRIVSKCLKPFSDRDIGIHVRLTGIGEEGTRCRARVIRGDRLLTTQTVEFSDVAMHGADLCAANTRTTAQRQVHFPPNDNYTYPLTEGGAGGR